jgi:hypothetical protein
LLGQQLTSTISNEKAKYKTRNLSKTLEKTMEITIGPGGRLNLERTQQHWHGDDPMIMQTSLFAGQEMMAIQKSDDEPDIYELHYLGFKAEGFSGIGAAQAAATEFARAVLARMSSMISD